MKAPKTLTTALTATALVSVIGFAYAQSTEPPADPVNRPELTQPADAIQQQQQDQQMQAQQQVDPALQQTQPAPVEPTPQPQVTDNPPPAAPMATTPETTPSSDATAPVVERAPRADRN